MGPSDSYRREVTRKVENGWQIESETRDRVTLVRRDFGDPGVHFVVAALTIWWAMGVPNVLYAAYRYFTGSQRTVVWKGRATETGEVRRARSSWGGEGRSTTADGQPSLYPESDRTAGGDVRLRRLALPPSRG